VPKGLLTVGGRRVIDRVAEALERATGRASILIANAADAATWLPDRAVYPDAVPGQGSLGGILTAVEVAAPALCVAWDMPFLVPELLRDLADLLADADVAVPESGSRRGVEPLCAAYGPACAGAIRAALGRGDQRAIGFHDAVRVTRLAAARVLQYGDPDVLFFNINAPSDLQRAEMLWRSRDSSR
jgi:molybdopterin-guanine dinucleotide biosynthesis protein A